MLKSLNVVSQEKEMVFSASLFIQNLNAYVPIYGIHSLMTRFLFSTTVKCEHVSLTPLGFSMMTDSIKLANYKSPPFPYACN